MAEVISSGVRLECRCGRSSLYYKWYDDSVPSEVTRIVTDLCPACDTGDFGSETWFDRNGNEVSQDDVTPSADVRKPRPQEEGRS